jgi:uncharacterized membrane protein (DUF2068 family)
VDINLWNGAWKRFFDMRFGVASLPELHSNPKTYSPACLCCSCREVDFVTRSPKGLRTVALFEGAKGLLVLLAGFGLLGLIHRNLQDWAEQLVRHLHLNPARHLPQIFLDAVGRLNDSHLLLIAAGALFYSLARFVEAYGLWNQRRWAEWIAVVSGSAYLPIEIYGLVRHVSWARIVIVMINLLVVYYVARVLVKSRRHFRSQMAS